MKEWEKTKSPNLGVLSNYAKRFIRWDLPLEVNEQSGDYDHIPFEQQCQSIRRFRYTGQLAYATISLGFLACPVALGCLAFDEGPVVMQIAALAVVGFIILFGGACSIIYRGNADSMWPRNNG